MTDANVGPAAELGASARQHEIEELKFLVGNSCSRAINLLMQSDTGPRELREEMAFLGGKATRLALLLEDEGAPEAFADGSSAV